MLPTFHICSLLQTASGPFPVSAFWWIFKLCYHSHVLPFTTTNYSFHLSHTFTIIIVKVFQSVLNACSLVWKTPKSIAEEEKKAALGQGKEEERTGQRKSKYISHGLVFWKSRFKSEVISGVRGQVPTREGEQTYFMRISIAEPLHEEVVAACRRHITIDLWWRFAATMTAGVILPIFSTGSPSSWAAIYLI